MKTFALIAALLVAPICGQAATPTPKAAVATVAFTQDVCVFWGTCAHYIVALNADGSGSYIGLEVAKTKGSVTLEVTKASFAKIVQRLRQMKFFALRDSYTSTDDGCKVLHTDQTSATFYAIRDGKVKRVEIYWGCELPGVTDNLKKLAHLINHVAGVNKLIGNGS